MVTDYQDSKEVSTSFNVYAINDSPDFNQENAIEIEEAQEDGLVQFSLEELLSGFSDKESANSVLRVEGLTVENGKIKGNADNVYIFEPNDDFHGEVTVNYLVDDEGGKTLASKVIKVNAVNDKPELILPLAQILPSIQEEGSVDISASN